MKEPTESNPVRIPVSRSEHLAWCKKRALEYVALGDTSQAFASMGSDLNKHPETENHSGMQIGMGLMMMVQLNSPVEMKKFIEGFN